MVLWQKNLSEHEMSNVSQQKQTSQSKPRLTSYWKTVESWKFSLWGWVKNKSACLLLPPLITLKLKYYTEQIGKRKKKILKLDMKK